jgi:hypothetical protein
MHFRNFSHDYILFPVVQTSGPQREITSFLYKFDKTLPLPDREIEDNLFHS